MFGFRSAATSNRDDTNTLRAVKRSHAFIEFDLTGKILTANDNFLNVLGYTLAEVQGRHHSMFVDAIYRESPEYSRFWADLRNGTFNAAQFRRIGKNGREVWIEASYNPVFDASGKAYKVVKVATDITEKKQQFADFSGQIEAIGKSQAVIEFELDGTVRTANQNFLQALGYTLEEIKGKHHSMFVEPAYKASADYRAFWDTLRRGEYVAARFKRIGKKGNAVWIEASYNPILDINGKPFKVVKYATDITGQMDLLKALTQNLSEIEAALNGSSREAAKVARAVEETSESIQVVAASAEEMATTVNEISDVMSRARTTTEAVHERSVSAGEATRRLSETSSGMAGIVGIIRTIAGQINLLALNASIESARAGEAGKGFAVVANEVKGLARQASNATDQIEKEIARLQVVSNDVVTMLSSIGTGIDAIREFVTGTAGSIEEQSAVTRDISMRMQTTARNVVGINGNMMAMTAAAEQVTSAVGSTREAARSLAG